LVIKVKLLTTSSRLRRALIKVRDRAKEPMHAAVYLCGVVLGFELGQRLP